MANKNSTLTYRWMEEVWNNGQENSIDELLDENAVVHGIETIKEKGPKGFKTFYRGFREQFPKLHVEVEHVVAEDDYETSRCTVNATTANGQNVNFTGMTSVRIKKGKIIEGWNSFDFLAMHYQLGFKMVQPMEQTA